MKVAILSPYPTFPFKNELGCSSVSYENNATWTVALVNHLAKIPDTKVHVVTESENIPESKTIVANGVNLHFIKAPEKYKTLTLWRYDRARILRTLDEIQPDIVHGQGIENQYGFAAVSLKWPHLLTIHGIPGLSNQSRNVGLFNRERIVELLAHSTIKNARNIVVITPFVTECYDLPPDRYRLFPIPNAIEERFFTVPPRPRESNLILSVGAIDRRKGNDILLRALALLKLRGISVRAIIAGPPADKTHIAELEQLIRFEHLDVHFTGFIPPNEVLALIQRCTMLALSSRHETAPMVVSEAMAVGTPVIASRVAGVPHMISDGVTGLLFQSENVGELADKIQRLLEDEATRSRLSGNARKYALEAHHPDRVARLTRAAYEDILAGRATKWVRSRSVENVLRRHPVVAAAARRLLAKVPLSVRLGKGFWRWYTFFEESESWPADRLLEYQLLHLRKLLSELRRTSAFHRERLRELDIEKLDSLETFRASVPTLSRDEFRKQFAELRSTEWQQQPVKKYQTSGTTGSALQFYHRADDEQREWAAICHQWKRVGYVPAASRRTEFRGLTRLGKLVEVFPEQHMIRCSILHLREEHVRHYAGEIRRHGTDFYHGYPSALYLLAREICTRGLDFPQPAAILLASEQVYDWQVVQIEKAFPKTKIFAHYGCAERTVLAGWCERRREYHVLPQYALVEVDPANSEIIGTNLFNSINGFVRYRMSDTALKTETGVCPDCGRAYSPRLIELGGRMEDYLYSPQRGWISPAIVTYALKSLHAIHEIQIVQNEKAVLLVRYTVTPAAAASAVESERQAVAADLARLFGPEMGVRFEQTDGFARSATGKFRWIICHLDELRDVGGSTAQQPVNQGG
jgi:phenylacetate-CoA ligase